MFPDVSLMAKHIFFFFSENKFSEAVPYFYSNLLSLLLKLLLFNLWFLSCL